MKSHHGTQKANNQYTLIHIDSFNFLSCCPSEEQCGIQADIIASAKLCLLSLFLDVEVTGLLLKE